MDDATEATEKAEELARLHKRNRLLVEERNAADATIKTLQDRLRSCEVIIASLVKRLGGDVFITTREQARMRDRMHAKLTKHGVRLVVQERGKRGAG